MSDVVDFKKRRDKKLVEDGTAGYFVNCPDDPGEIVSPLGEGESPEAVGVMFAQSGPGEPRFAGWAMTPEEARKFAAAILSLADRCK